MTDSDHILLLRSARPASGLPKKSGDRRPAGATGTSEGLLVATVYYLDEPEDAEFLGYFERTLRPVMTDTGASPLAYFRNAEMREHLPSVAGASG